MSKVTITGKVTDENGEALIGVSVFVLAAEATSTDAEGLYTIQIDPGDDLTFTYTGYATVDKPVYGESEINVVMDFGGGQMDE